MNRSTLFISAVLVAVSATGAGFWVSHPPRFQAGQDKQPASVAQLSTQQHTATDPDGEPVRTVYPGPQAGAVQRLSRSVQNEVAAAPSRPPAAVPAAVAGEPAAVERDTSEVPPSPKPDVVVPADSADVSSSPASAAAEPAASGTGIDLNTDSVEELNALGAGMIGRRIITFRPYSSPEDLITWRVLKKSDFDIIKTSIMVR